MAKEIDEAKGRVKRAAGELTGDEKLKRKGTIDKAAGKAKKAVRQGGRQGKGRSRQAEVDRRKRPRY